MEHNELEDRVDPKEVARNIKDLTVNGKCSGCGLCCVEFIPLTVGEQKTIANFLSKHPEIKEHRHINDDGSMEMVCPFRNDESKRCEIYEVRPRVCRRFVCNLSPEKIALLKDENLDRATYNGRKREHYISLHALFFNDVEWEVEFYRRFSGSKTKEELIEFILKLNPLIATVLINGVNEFAEAMKNK